MCAIIGKIGGKIDKELFRLARDTMISRGPDGSGDYYDDAHGVALGHRRLSIIDLSSGGSQPMYSKDGQYILVFNGEIFNYLELRKELDYQFKTKSDTEVLLAAYLKWGPACVLKLNGQFAFAIYDAVTKELFCTRDRLGIKPIFYTIAGDTFAFASEIKALLKLGIVPEPDNEIIFDYLRYGFYDHSRGTFFKNVKRLLPGEYAIWRDGRLAIHKYWDLAQIAEREFQYENLKKSDAIGMLKDLMADSIKLQFRSDVPVGLNLSSGLDSMSMLFFAEAVTGKHFRIFSAGLADKNYDEVGHLKQLLSSEQRVFLHTSTLTPQKVWPLIHKLILIQDEPFGGLATAHYLNLYEETHLPSVKVLLEGQGVDEILAGYSYYQSAIIKDNVSQDGTYEGAPETINADFFDKFKKDLNIAKPFVSGLRNAQYRDIGFTKLPRVLRFNDHISLAYSKELRVPYLDHRLVEFCFFLPDHLKIDSRNQKILLHDAMKDIIPHTEKNKPKFFFGAFQTEWLRKHFKLEVYDLVNSASFRSRPYWDYTKVKNKVDSFFAGRGNNSFFLWQWINLELWLRNYKL